MERRLFLDYGALENRLEEWLSADGAPFTPGDGKATCYFSLQAMWEVNRFTIVVDKCTPHVITVITWWTLTVGQISKLEQLVGGRA